MQIGKIILLILIISVAEYFVIISRRKLIIKHDDRLILLLEAIIIFTVMVITIGLFTKKEDIKKAIKQFSTADFITIGASSIVTVIITILWVAVIDKDELSKVQFISTGIDMFIALAGGYLLLNEGITTKKVTAFGLLLVALYLLSY